MSSVLLLFTNAMHKSKKKGSSKPETIDLTRCRTCNNEKGDVPIFHNPIKPNISEEIFNFSGVTVSEMDNLPQNMCQCCLDLLNGCIMFRDICQKTNMEMVELSIKKESSYTDDDIKHESGDNFVVVNCDTDDIKHEVDDKFKIDNCENDNDFNTASPEPNSPDVHKCDTCNNEFTNFKTYKVHLKHCKKLPRKRRKKNKDQVDHLKDIKKPPKRRRKVVNTQSFLCDTCGKTCASQRNLLVHINTHENIFPFKCDECPYRGRTVCLLKVHKRSHMVDKPYKCTLCPRATSTSSNLARHMAQIHSTVKPYKCTYCDKEFGTQISLKVHNKYNHLTAPVECDICFKKYQTNKSLVRHRNRTHNLKRELQGGRLPSYLLAQQKETDNEQQLKF